MKAITQTRPATRFEVPRRNCYTCAFAGPDGYCGALTLDEDVDQPVIDWVTATHTTRDGDLAPLPPTTADGCPAWEPA